MDCRKIRISIEEILYYTFFPLLIFTKGIGLDEGSVLFRICLLASFFLLGCKLLLGRYRGVEILIIGLLGVWGAATFMITGSLGMFVYVLLIVGMKNIPVKRVFKVGAAVWSLCMFFTITAALFFGRTGVRLVHEKLGIGPILRESLGYTHPNVLHITYVVFMAFILYLCKAKGKKLAGIILLLLAGDALIFMYSLSFTGLLISFVYLICFFYFSFRKQITKPEAMLIQCILPGCMILSLLLPLLVEDGILYQICNRLLNNRIWAITVYYADYPVTLFGMRSDGITFSIDNSYVSALMNYGVFFMAVMAFVYWMLIRYCLKREQRGELAIICTFLFAGLSEPFLFNASVKNITVIFIGSYLFWKISRESGFSFLSSRNKTLEISMHFWQSIKSRIALMNKKTVISIFLVLVCGVFLFLFPKNCVKLDRVYVDEKLCDCEGETTVLTEDMTKERTLIIGREGSDIPYYCFTAENSSLIAVMDIRAKISISLYLALAGSLSGMILLLITQKKQKSGNR